MESQVRRIAGQYLQRVRSSGHDDLRATCPLCDHTRTFMISLRTGVWYCFHCGQRGTLLGFLRHMGLSGKQLDDARSALNLPPPLPRRVRQRLEFQRAAARKQELLPEFLIQVYEGCPLALLEAGFDEEVLYRHEVGFDERNRRITFPIRDHLGRLVAINGRAETNDGRNKYKVYDARPPTDTEAAGELHGIVENYMPSNRDFLYGYDTVFPLRFYDKRSREEPLIVVEGYKACLWLRQHGFRQTVALQGSSLTAAQRRQLQKLQGPYYILLDGESGKQTPDKYGRCAAVRIVRQLSRSGRVFLPMYVVDGEEKPEGVSPDDLSPEELNYIIANAKTLAQLTIGSPESK